MATAKNTTFENCLAKDFKKDDSDVIYRFCHLNYGAGQRIEIVGEIDSDGHMFAFNDPDSILDQIKKGDIVEVSEVADLH